jgi:hypothetical protein
MRGESTSDGRTSYRRLVGALGGAGAFAVVTIMALSSVASAGVAHPAAFPGAYWSPFTYRDNSGCAQAHAFPAHWSAATGAGKSRGATSAKTCPAYRGGTSVGSYGDVGQTLNVWAPVTLSSGAGGVNVTWSLQITASESGAVTGPTSCPTTVSHYDYNYGYTWVNYTYTDGYCYMDAYFSVYGSAELYDMTTGTYYSSTNYWSGIYNETYSYNDTFGYMYNYSNSSYWSSNYSYGPTSSNYSYGAPASISTTVTPTWYINGTFVSTDSYQVFTYVDSYQYSEIETWTGHAATSINMATGANHEDLLPFSIW